MASKTIQEQIAVMQAYADGKEIQFRLLRCPVTMDNPWETIKNPQWSWADCDYRIKPVEQDSINWDHVHPDYNYMARDESGSVCVYEELPNKANSFWFPSGSSYSYSTVEAFASFKRGETDWKDSLVFRPMK